jgi:DNA-directed RNA polymerase specialized sigma24 family protein
MGESVELRALLEDCRAEEPIAWEDFTTWAKARAHTALRGFEKLNGADREDVVAETLKNLVPAVRRGEIRGTSDGEIDAYVCRAMRNRALNLLRERARRRAAGELPNDGLWDDAALEPEAPYESPTPDVRAHIAEQLETIEKALLSWSAEDRYLFLAKLQGVSARTIQETLRRPPFRLFAAIATVDTRFHRLRRRLMAEIEES